MGLAWLMGFPWAMGPPWAHGIPWAMGAPWAHGNLGLPWAHGGVGPQVSPNGVVGPKVNEMSGVGMSKLKLKSFTNRCYVRPAGLTLHRVVQPQAGLPRGPKGPPKSRFKFIVVHV